MKKIIIIAYFFINTLVVVANIKLELSTTNNQPIKQVVAGVPFLLKLTLENAQGATSQPAIKGLESFQARCVGNSMHTINNVTKVSYVYQIRIDKSGNYTVGPGEINTRSGKQIASAITIPVVDESSQGQAQTKKNRDAQANAPFLRLLTNKKDVVLGEKITCSLRFYYPADDAVVPLHIITQDAQDITYEKTANSGAELKATEIDGKTYNYYEWQWAAVAQKVGNLIIPAQGIDYELPISNNGQWGAFSLFFGPRAEIKQIYSNTAKITVHNLPPSEHKPLFLGTLAQVQLSVDPVRTQVGKGIILTLECLGTNLESLHIADLYNLPPSLKYYPSKESMLSDNQEKLERKRIEFVIQALQEGTFEIVPQKFWYFNTQTYRHESIETSAAFVVVDPKSQSSSSTNDNFSEKDTRVHAFEEKKETEKELPVICSFNLYKGQNRLPALPLWLFICIIFFILLFFFLSAFMHHIKAMHATYQSYIRSKMAFYAAQKRLNNARKNGNVAQLHALFIDLFNDRTVEKSSSLYAREQLLRIAGLSAEDSQKWHAFVLLLNECVFMNIPAYIKPEHVFNDALMWLDRLRDLI